MVGPPQPPGMSFCVGAIAHPNALGLWWALELGVPLWRFWAAMQRLVSNPFVCALCSLWWGGGGGGLAQGLGVRLVAFGGAHWPLATAHSDPLWAQTCFGCVNGAPGCLALF